MISLQILNNMKPLLTILTFVFLMQPLIYAECDCPQITMDYDYICPINAGELFVTVSFYGGCAMLNSGSFTVDNGNFEQQVSPGEALGFGYYNGESPKYTVIDENPECQQVFQLPAPQLLAEYGHGYIYARPCDFEPEVPEGASLETSTEYFGNNYFLHTSITTNYECEATKTHYVICDSVCPPVEIGLLHYDGQNPCNFQGRVILSGFHSAQIWEEGFSPYTLESPSHLIYYGIGEGVYVDQNFDRNEGLQIEIEDEILDCNYSVEIPAWDCPGGCSCDDFAVDYKIACLDDGMAELTYYFTKSCPGQLIDGSIEVMHNGINYFTTDSLSITVPNGTSLDLEQVRYSESGFELCNRSFEFGEVVTDCSPMSNANLDQTLENANLSISPNPFDDALRIDLDLKYESPISIQVADLSGRIVYEQQYLSQLGKSSFALDLGSLPSGVYLVQVYGDGRFWGRKVVRG